MSPSLVTAAALMVKVWFRACSERAAAVWFCACSECAAVGVSHQRRWWFFFPGEVLAAHSVGSATVWSRRSDSRLQRWCLAILRRRWLAVAVVFLAFAGLTAASSSSRFHADLVCGCGFVVKRSHSGVRTAHGGRLCKIYRRRVAPASREGIRWRRRRRFSHAKNLRH